MKPLITIILFVVPSLTFAQSLTEDQTFNVKERVEFTADPLTASLLAADIPCNDGIDGDLKKSVKGRAVTEDCQAYQRLIDERLSSTTSVDTGSEQPVNLRPYYIMAGTTTVISIIFIVAL